MYKIQQGKKQSELLAMNMLPETDVNEENRQTGEKG